MDNQRIIQLAQKIVNGSITVIELEEFNNWYYSDEDAAYKVNAYNSKDELAVDMFKEIIKRTGLHREQPKQHTLWLRIAISAAVVMIIAAMGIWFLTKPGPKTDGELVYAQEILPGKQGATLTLANGKKINLSNAANGEIAKQAGISVNKSTDGELVYEIKESIGNPDQVNKLTTAKGETYILTLPDKSKVWLNAASSLTYSTSLNNHGLRKVKLEGEAYFEIFKDKTHPFIVETNNQEVEVLGTHFNINSYPDEPAVATTLVEGSVKVSSGRKSIVIRPGEQALNKGAVITVNKVNIDNVTDWKDGDFYLNRVSFKEAMRKIARWYDVEVVFADDLPDDIESGGWLSRDTKLSVVLRSIEKSGQVHFKVENGKIYVSK